MEARFNALADFWDDVGCGTGFNWDMKSLPIFLALFCALSLSAAERIRVACVGDSITFGAGVAGRETNSYPAVLQTLLGTNYWVRNFGVSGSTLLKKGDRPYWKERMFAFATDFKPNIVVIKLGTNDTKPQNQTNLTEFASDLTAMIEQFAALDVKPKIYLCLPVPVYQTQWGINEAVLAEKVLPAIRQVAADRQLPLIDLHSALSNQPGWFPDHVHPNAAGARRMAETIFSALK